MSGLGNVCECLAYRGDVWKQFIALRCFCFVHYTTVLSKSPVHHLHVRRLARFKSESFMYRVGQNRIYTPYMTVYVMISLPKKTYVHCTV